MRLGPMDLASQGCLPESTSSKALGQTKERQRRSWNTVLTEVNDLFEVPQKVSFNLVL
ncbi:hypothetical protein J23TS9_45410 [Paenibacillus sp. J23TS9]|nr:hypothetical protein J23TS9_45410 [Paenibacillus sp. J23TS9]